MIISRTPRAAGHGSTARSQRHGHAPDPAGTGTVIGAIGEEGLDQSHLASLDGVEKVVPIMKPYKLASREFHEEDSVVEVGGGEVPKVKVGGTHAACIAGPCAVENEKMLNTIARHVRDGGATILRGGAFKPRTSALFLSGPRRDGAQVDAGVRRRAGHADLHRGDGHAAGRADRDATPTCFQIGARNMQNFDLLREVGKTRKPVLLKRGLAATVKDWLLSAEYVLSQGNRGVILCERGIKTFEDSIRYTMDISSIPVAQAVEPPADHRRPEPRGRQARSASAALAMAGMAAGAHGIIVEVHYCPAEAQCDGPQALLPEMFKELMGQLRQIGRDQQEGIRRGGGAVAIVV